MKIFFSSLLTNFKNIFRGRNLIWHILAIVSTFVLVMLGFDWIYFINTRPITFKVLWMSAGTIGFIVPVLAPLVLYLVGKYAYNKKQFNTLAIALAQAALLGWLVSSLYKAFTGRIQPDLYNTVSDISHGFRFGFWEGGIFWGWPSSHTAVAFAMVVTLFILLQKKFKWFLLIYALFIGFGASVGFHWFSEVIAGIIFGSLVGVVVGRYFKTQYFIE